MSDLSPREKLDGFPVESYGGRFSGTFDIDEDDGRKVHYGDEVVIVVFAKVKDPVFKEDKNGDMRRVNVFTPDEAWVCTDPAKRTAVLNALTVESSARLFDEPKLVETPSVPTVVQAPTPPPALEAPAIDQEEEVVEAVRFEAEPVEIDDEEEVFSPSDAGVDRVGRLPQSKDRHLQAFLRESV